MKDAYNIIHCDENILVIDKAAGVLSIPDRFNGGLPNCYDLLRKKFDEIHVVHRLDRETSGLLIFARNTDWHRYLNGRFENRDVRKIYLALVQGKPERSEGTIDLPIAENPSKPGLVKINRGKGKPSQTNYVVTEVFRPCSLVTVSPVTGRTHQIRIHFQAIGHPLMIDSLYGNSTEIFLSQLKRNYRGSKEDERPLMSRLTLHAGRISFVTPGDKEVSYEAPLPKDFSALLRQLRNWQS